ncbi:MULTISPECIES: hypothetical protein [Oceanobacillus]|uniref:Uncharacterized protein n=1 Tax=Oceanobacillus kimchii TaxID=746691 RepID=A0ABQ5TNB6_9BACI|nr:hypothetical protein [Oceanobacillus kimchii]GLO68303.1 hypothetical protein MACH08_40870 [Oceanobacillus kimchii]
MEIFMKIIFTILVGVIIGSYKSLMKNDFYLDLPSLERGDSNKITRIYIGSLITYTVFYSCCSAMFIFGGSQTVEMVSSFTAEIDFKQ